MIQQVLDGDLEAFGRLVGDFQDMAVAYAYAVLKDIHLAEDAAQEAFVQAYHDLGQLRQAAAFPGWLRRLVFKQFDRIRRSRPPVVALEGVVVRSAVPSPDVALEAEQTRGLVQQAIAALPAAQRSVTTLFYISEFPQKQIAVFLDLPLSTVKKRLQRARIGLKERMIEMVRDEMQDNRPSKDDVFVDRVLETVAPNQDQHGEEILGLFERRDQAPNRHLWRQGRMTQSTLDWRVSRIGCVDGKVAVVWGIFDLAMRIGGVQVRVKWTPLSRPFSGKNKTAFKLPRDGLPLASGSPMIGVVFGDYNSRNRCSALGSSPVRSHRI